MFVFSLILTAVDNNDWKVKVTKYVVFFIDMKLDAFPINCIPQLLKFNVHEGHPKHHDQQQVTIPWLFFITQKSLMKGIFMHS